MKYLSRQLIKHDEKSTDQIQLFLTSTRCGRFANNNASDSILTDVIAEALLSCFFFSFDDAKNSDDEQIPIRDMKSNSAGKHGQPTSFNLDSNQYYQQVDEEQAHIRGLVRETKKKSSTDELDSQGYDNLENLTKPKRKVKGEEKKFTHEYQRDQEMSPSTLSIPTGPVRSSAGSMRTRTSDYDSGFGTHNTTKLSRDSKLNTSTMDESHYQSLDEEQRERRRYSDDDEQNSMTSVTSSRSSGSGAASPGTYSNKYTKRFNSSSSLKPHRETYRRKPSGHSDGYPSDIETHITGSFDPLPPPPPSSSSFAIYQPRRSRRQHHSWQPQRTVSLRSGSTTHHRSASIESLDSRNDQTPYHRPQTAPSISSKVTDPHRQMGRKYESGLVHRPSVGSKHPERMYQSSVFIGESHTHRRSQEALHQQQYYERLQAPSAQPTYSSPNHRLYLNPQTGMIYRYESKRNPTPSNNTYYSPSSQVKSSAELYKCVQCGSMTNYQHRHHTNAPTRRVPPEFDDPGYESGHKRSKQRRRPIERVASSGSDTDEASTYLDMAMLNEACERAKKVQHRSQNLSRHISRQLKLVLSTM